MARYATPLHPAGGYRVTLFLLPPAFVKASDPRSEPGWVSPSTASTHPLGLTRCSHHTILTNRPERELKLLLDVLGGTVVHNGRNELLGAVAPMSISLVPPSSAPFPTAIRRLIRIGKHELPTTPITRSRGRLPVLSAPSGILPRKACRFKGDRAIPSSPIRRRA